MDAEERRQPVALQEPRGGDVGRDHALLDDPVRDGALGGLEPRDPAVRAEHDPGPGHVEVDGPPFVAGAAQRLVRIAQPVEHRRRPGEPRAHPGDCPRVSESGVAALERVRHLGVGQARPRTDDALEEPGAVHPARPGDDQLAPEAKAILVRTQRAQSVGDRLREHRDDPIGKVDGVAAKARFLVQRGAGTDVGGHVGDRHHHPPPSSGAFAPHRVVEVARVLPVDGDEPDVAQVLAAVEVGAAHPVGQRRRFRHRLPGPRDRQLVRPDRDVDLHPRQHPGPQHLLDRADRRVAPGRRLGDTGDDVVAVSCIGARIGRNEDVVVEPRIVGTHEGDAALAPQAPDHPADTPSQHLDQRPLAAPVAVDLHHPGHHAVPVHQRAHLPGSEEQIDARVVGPHEAEPVAMADDAPGDEVHPIDESELPPAVADDLAVALHRAQPPLQRLLLGRSPKCMRIGDAGERDRCPGLREKLGQRAAFGEVLDAHTDAASGAAAQTWRAR